MPIFEYKCNNCGNVFEVLTLSRQNLPSVQCDKCKSEKVDKIISASHVRSHSGGGLSLPSAAPGCAGNSGFS